jgi:serine/threonine-protein kinase RsbW
MRRFDVAVADLSQLRGLRHQFAAWLARARVDGSCGAELVLALHEAVANAAEHAEASDSISVHAEFADGAVLIEVADRGRWKEPRLVPDTGSRGRGLPIIRTLVEDVTIQTTRAGTTVQMRQRVYWLEA